MTLTAFLLELARKADALDPHLAERIRTAACISTQLEEDARILRRDRAVDRATSNAERMYRFHEAQTRAAAVRAARG